MPHATDATGVTGIHGTTDSGGSAAPESPPASASIDLDELWGRVQAAVQKMVRREQFETWFRRASLTHIDDESVSLTVQNGFARDWLKTYYEEILERALESVLGSPYRIVFEVDAELTVPQRRAEEPDNGHDASPTPSVAATPSTADRADRDGGASALLHSSDVVLNAQYTFDNFVVGPCNRFAHAACVGVAESPGKVYNPLFIHGRVGLGKTHLLQSLCHTILQRNARSRILYLSCETFVNHFISALENGDLQKFRGKYRNVDLLVVDDIHVLANKERTQEEFFHTFNTLYNAGHQIVLSSDSPPVDIPTLQERLISRFKWGLVTEVENPCYETRMAILKRKSRTRGRQLPEDVARLLAERIDTNIRELEGAVTKLLGFASLTNRPITVELAQECLREHFPRQKREPAMEDIVQVVTQRFGVKLSELQSKRRNNAIAFPRQIAMYLARRITRMSLEEIGGYFGGRDHSTVLHAVKKLTRLVEEDPQTRQVLVELNLELQSPSGA
ncbi:MAG: chromosomal replication initiator protein DnaA [Planctomycetota bacterium]|nr:chromosomal replication initiator protein DnaA [Planctomycetota bacterium]